MVIKSSYVMRIYQKSCWQSKTASMVYFVWQNVKYRYGKNCGIFTARQISATSLNKMALVSAKLKIRTWNFERMVPDNKYKSQKISNLYCKSFLKYSRMFIGLDSTVHPHPIPHRIGLRANLFIMLCQIMSPGAPQYEMIST